jgi:hypothetical protein
MSKGVTPRASRTWGMTSAAEEGIFATQCLALQKSELGLESRTWLDHSVQDAGEWEVRLGG